MTRAASDMGALKDHVRTTWIAGRYDSAPNAPADRARAVVAPEIRATPDQGSGRLVTRAARGAVTGAVVGAAVFLALATLPTFARALTAVALVGSGAFLLAGRASLGVWAGRAAFNGVASLSIFIWAVAAGEGNVAVGVGFLAHAIAWGLNAAAEHVRREPEAGTDACLGAAALSMALLVLTLGL